jgi:S-DNA-T family DNA segregation ATPase FtsK/SpoIIIE
MTRPIHWRIDRQGVHDVSVDIGPDTTLGEVAAAIAAVVSPADLPPGSAGDTGCQPTLTLAPTGGSGPIDPRRAAHEAAPRAGSTVVLHTCDDTTVFSYDPGVDAPVLLRCGSDTTRLRYGTNNVTPDVAVHVGFEVRVRARGVDPVSLDGERVLDQTAVPDGGLLRVGSWAASIQVLGDLRPPRDEGPWHPHASRRARWPTEPAAQMDLPTPPEQGRLPGFPWLSMAVPVLLAIGIWVASRSLMWSGFMAISVGYVVATAIESRHESRAEMRFRVARFHREMSAIEEELEKAADEEHERDELLHPSLREISAWFDPLTQRVWERGSSHPAPLSVRLGTALLPADTAPNPPGGVLERDRIDQVIERHRLHRRAAVVDLSTTGGLGVIGDPAQAGRLLDAVLVQLAVLVPPDLLNIRGGATDGAPRHWSDWLPHRHGEAPFRVELAGPRPDSHLDSQVGSHTDSHPDPRLDAPTSGRPEEPVLLWSAPNTIGLPDSVRAVLHLHPQAPAELCIDGGPPLDVDMEPGDPDLAEHLARRLCGLAVDGMVLPTASTLRGLGVPLDASTVARSWADDSRSDRRELTAPLGIGTEGGVVHVDLVADGPHSLVAGTTGSGKSELLRTWTAALAAIHPPSRMNLVLVDYKGGTSFGPLVRLPHCAGQVTDLTPLLAQRALSGLRAELRRRERVVEASGAGDVLDMDPETAPASLVIVIDEFATLLEELPEFVDGVLDIARRGRSLGIHLIMATQRPTGVISDAIRANTSLRIALRLPDPEDSLDVIGSPDSATISRDRPGGANIRFGHDRLQGLQVAHSGSPVSESPAAWVAPLGRRPVPTSSPSPSRPSRPASEGCTELEVLVEACRAAAAELGVPRVEPPWCEPLPALVRLDTGTVEEQSPAADATTCVTTREQPGTLTLGLVDLPEEQRLGLLHVDLLRGGGVLAVGAPGSGTSTTLVSLAAAALQIGWQVAAIGTGGDLGGLGAVPADDHELVHRILRSLLSLPGEVPTLLLLDDLAAFELAQRNVNRGEAMDLLTQLATSGPAHGVSLGISARRRCDVPQELLHTLGERIVHRCHDLDGTLSWDAPVWLADPTLPPGRVAHRGRAAQVGISSIELPPAWRPERLPTCIDPTRLDRVATGSDRGPTSLPVGLLADSMSTASVDLGREHLLVAGGPGSGKSSTLRTIAAAAARHGLRTAQPTDPAHLKELMAGFKSESTPTPSIVLIDDAERWCAEIEGDDVLLDALDTARTHPLRLVLAGDAGMLWRSHASAIDRLRMRRCGIVLGDDAHDQDALLHARTPRRDDLPGSPGRGWLVWRGRPALIQVAMESRQSNG